MPKRQQKSSDAIEHFITGKAPENKDVDSDPELNPWHFNQYFQNWLNLQQIWLTHSWEILLWQQTLIQKMMMENTRWLMHCFQLYDQPHTLYRYLRMNWSKPYETLSQHSMSSSHLVSQFWIKSLSAWQDGWRSMTRVD